MSVAADDAILGGVAMVTINPSALEESVSGVLCSPRALRSIGMRTCALKWRQKLSAFCA